MTVTAEHSTHDLRRRLTGHLVAEGVLRSPGWIRAFSTVPRERFVPAFTLRTADGVRGVREGDTAYLDTVYSDASLITQRDTSGTATSSSSQPRVMATMLEALPDDDSTSVLEIGTGTGYNAALLCERYGSPNVTSVDIDPDLTAAARQRLHAAGYAPTLITGDGTAAHASDGPYNAVIATCGLPRIPQDWLAQVVPGGTIVANLGYGLTVLHTDEHDTVQGHFLPEMAAFMTARGSSSHTNGGHQGDMAALMRATGSITTVHLQCDVTAPMSRFLGGMLHPDTVDFTLTGEDGHVVHIVQHPASGAWARMTMHDTEGARIDYDGPGGRNLWGERLPLMTAWAEAGRPGPERYGLTVSGDGGHTLWLDGPGGRSWELPA
ncbi:methyltransferase domain-containing protein [Streptomyces qinglanensis]|uniref:methyltransferase domain-containing protein n=1 Tax=Streptomyces qinglanensis TaxID=943816 RepID=UPI0037AD538A